VKDRWSETQCVYAGAKVITCFLLINFENFSNSVYRIQRFPWQMSEDKVRRVLKEALKVWSDVTPLTFNEVINQEADIVIDFTR